MKKFLSIILTLTFCIAAFSAIAPSASAESGTITEAEIVDLIERAWNFYLAAVRGHVSGGLEDSSQEIKVDISGKAEVSYYRVYEERLPGGSYEGMKKVAESIYYGDYLSEQMYKYPTYSSDYRWIPNYYVDKDGVVYTSIQVVDYEFVSLYGYEVSSEENAEDRVSADSIEIKFIGGNADSASAYVRCNVGTKGEDINHYWIRCDYKRADDGWRISGGPFVGMLRYNDFNMLDEWERELVIYDGIFAVKDNDPDHLSDDEAVRLLQKAFLIYCQANDRLPYLSGSSSEDEFYYNDGDIRSAYYVLLDPTMLYGGSMEAFRAAVDEVYTEKAAEKVYTAYCWSDCPLFIQRDGKTYVAWGDAQRDAFTLSFEENNDYDFTVLERTPDKITARIKAWLSIYEDYGFHAEGYINCVFVKTADGWKIDDCGYTDMMTSIAFDNYTLVDSPATGDNAFDAIAICLGGMAIVMSVLCLVRRKREF
ncbi:MAG: hypothetical protein J6S71_01595 [Clostridia bacterium]|nr:hypothetical protein [Clostridia bacterium]